MREDVFEIRSESRCEQTVCLIQYLHTCQHSNQSEGLTDQDFDPAQFATSKPVASYQIAQSPRSRHDYMGPLLQFFRLRHHIHSTNDCDRRQPQRSTYDEELLGQLIRELPSRLSVV